MEVKYIAPQISIKTLKNFILDNGLTENDTLVLNTYNFDEIVLEYRKVYDEGITVPYFLLGVLIKDDEDNIVPLGRIGLLKDDFESRQDPSSVYEAEFSDWDVAYRCGYCGNIVDESGYELTGDERSKTIRYIEKYENPIVKHVHGRCCRDRW